MSDLVEGSDVLVYIMQIRGEEGQYGTHGTGVSFIHTLVPP